MKEVLFYTHQLNFRGTTNSLVDYAHFNQEILGNRSVIVYNSSFQDDGLDILSQKYVIDLLKEKFEVIAYEAGPEDDFRKLEDIASKFDLFYFQKAGFMEEPEIKSTKTANHVVFQYCDPHGDQYAYISEWLTTVCSGGKHPYVPYIVDLPEPNFDLRAKLGIHKNKFVFGRHGGFYTFDIPWVWGAVSKVLNTRDDVVFLFANTNRVIEHPNVIYLPAFFGNQEKANFINACDGMLHARMQGESFGSSICEFLHANKPVLAWEGGNDLNHKVLLHHRGLTYNQETLVDKMLNIRSILNRDFKSIVNDYTPDKVIKKFDEVFLQ